MPSVGGSFITNRLNSRSLRVLSQAAKASPADAPAAKPAAKPRKPRAKKVKAPTPSPRINVIPVSRWPDGVPPAMGSHYMPSGLVAPVSQSKGAGINVAPLYFAYPSGDLDVTILVHDSDSAAAASLTDLIAKASAEAVASKGSFTLAVSGGSMVKMFASLVGRQDIDFGKWWVLFADERNVPHSSPDSSYKAVAEELLSKVPVPAGQVLAIQEGLPVDQAATQYAGQLLGLGTDVLPLNAEGLPALDLVLLGVGPDGHVASLFPNTKQAAATEGWVLPVAASPKPPAERITLTMPLINAAKRVGIVALGEGKSEVVQRVLEVQSHPGALPAQLVRPSTGSLTWFLDQASAAALRVDDWAKEGSNSKKYPRSL